MLVWSDSINKICGKHSSEFEAISIDIIILILVLCIILWDGEVYFNFNETLLTSLRRKQWQMLKMTHIRLFWVTQLLWIEQHS